MICVLALQIERNQLQLAIKDELAIKAQRLRNQVLLIRPHAGASDPVAQLESAI